MASTEDALAWARRGFRVFPLVAMTKVPAIDAFQLKATTDEETIKGWWPADADFNIGVLTSNMVVVDVDVRGGKDGLRNYQQLGGHYDTLVVRTPAGGFHCYFKGPDSGGRIGFREHVDIRSHNNYVIAPGSFAVDQAKGNAGSYELVVDKPMADLPVPIAIELKPPRARAISDEYIGDLDAPTAIANASVWLSNSAPLAIQGEGGDDTTYRVAVKLVKDYALTIETAYQLMWALWNERCLPAWDGETLWRKIENADQYGTGEMGSARPEAFFGHSVHVPSPSELVAGTLAQIRWGNARDGVDIPKRAWLLRNFLMMRYLTVIVGQSGMGKSNFVMAVTAHLASGREFLGFQTDDGLPVRCVVYNAEDDLDEQSRRLMGICIAYGIDYKSVRENILLLSGDQMEVEVAKRERGLVVNEPQISALTDMLKDEAIKFAAFGPLAELHTADENGVPDMKTVMALFRRIAREANIALLLDHHTNRRSSGNSGKAGDTDMVRGSTAIVSAGRVVGALSNPDAADLEELGLPAEARTSLVRLDTGKLQFGQLSARPKWMAWKSVPIPSGDEVGVLMPASAELAHRREEETVSLASAMRDCLLDAGEASCSLIDMLERLQKAHAQYERIPKNNLRAMISKLLVKPVDIEGDRIELRRVRSGNRELIMVTLTGCENVPGAPK